MQVQKAEMADVIVEYGPIYWTQNNTLYPTTTTTTTVSVCLVVYDDLCTNLS